MGDTSNMEAWRIAGLPDNSHLPVSNRPETVLGATIASVSIAWLAVSLRLYVRYKERIWGYDDLFVLLAGLTTTAGSWMTCLMPAVGMGKHLWTLSGQNLIDYFMYVWATNVTYASSTTFIKLAILFQYARLFKGQDLRLARTLTTCLIALIALWGFTFTILALFSCRPIKKNWAFNTPGTCVAWGSKEPDVLFMSFAAHSASNMFFDMLVLMLPVPFLKKLRMNGKTKFGIIGLFSIGAIVTMMSVSRMVSLAYHRAGTVPVFDPTFAAPLIFIFSVLEINIAVLCASMPIFWPLVTSLVGNKILVVNEIEIHTSRRSSRNLDRFVSEGEGFVGIPDMDMGKGMADSGGRTSRMSVMVSGKCDKLSHPGSKLHHFTHHYGGKQHKHKTSTSSSNKDIQLGRRISQESSRNLNLRTKDSSGTLSYSSSPELGRSGSMDPDNDRYMPDWTLPSFEKQRGDRR